MRYKSDVGGIFSRVTQEHLCISGGEPFLHDLRPLLEASLNKGIQVHIETSGTHDICAKLDGLFSAGHIWITCSPKRNFDRRNLHVVSEWKFIVTAGIGISVIDKFFDYPKGKSPRTEDMRKPIFLQPVNNIDSIDRESLEKVMGMLTVRPEWRLSIQMHKMLGLR